MKGACIIDKKPKSRKKVVSAGSAVVKKGTKAVTKKRAVRRARATGRRKVDDE